ncbi:MAG: N-acetyl sugar amidotransferase [Tannerella sp.]|nr:N-acetyl sugar amidotransferase [Tannerella sp.]
MKYCTNCVLPDTHETVSFDNAGVCNVCRLSEKKHLDIDWDARKKMLDPIVERYKGKDIYDCILPYSGGKDSVFQLWYVVIQLQMKPLVVRFDHWGFRPLVDENNTKIFKKLGVDVLQFTPNWQVVKKLMKQSLIEAGDFCWHCHTGVFAHTMQVAVRYNIPLVIWGESPAEYRAYVTHEELTEFNETLFNQMVNLGLTADQMYELLGGQVEKRDLYQYVFPSKQELDKLGAKSIYLGSYIKWNTKQNVEIIKRELGWKGQPVEGIPPEYDYEKIECQWQGIRDYCKYIKRGHGRTNHLACIDIRNGEMTRDKGYALALEYDGKRPASLDLFLKYLDMTEEEFVEAVQKNEVAHWGFDLSKVEKGKPLPDADLWDQTV